MRPEHEFAVTVDEWEWAVFNNAAYFTVFRRTSQFQQFEKARFEEFPDAVAAAMVVKPFGLVYAITKSERSCVVTKDRWPECLRLWNEKHPVKKSRNARRK